MSTVWRSVWEGSSLTCLLSIRMERGSVASTSPPLKHTLACISCSSLAERISFPDSCCFMCTCLCICCAPCLESCHPILQSLPWLCTSTLNGKCLFTFLASLPDHEIQVSSPLTFPVPNSRCHALWVPSTLDGQAPG